MGDVLGREAVKVINSKCGAAACAAIINRYNIKLKHYTDQTLFGVAAALFAHGVAAPVSYRWQGDAYYAKYKN